MVYQPGHDPHPRVLHIFSQVTNMNESIESSVLRLNELLPLKARQDRLSPAFRGVHRAVIVSLVMRGRPPTRTEIATLVGEQQVDMALDRLGNDDLVVLTADRREVLGAYPVTSETTPHVLEVNGHSIHAMCAISTRVAGSPARRLRSSRTVPILWRLGR